VPRVGAAGWDREGVAPVGDACPGDAAPMAAGLEDAQPALKDRAATAKTTTEPHPATWDLMFGNLLLVTAAPSKREAMLQVREGPTSRAGQRRIVRCVSQHVA